MKTSILQTALQRLLQPLIRLLLRQGMTYDEFAEVARRTYVDVAARDFQIEGRKQTIARVAMLTGIQRKEVSRLQKLSQEGNEALDSNYNRGARITSGWRRDSEFTSAGKPKSLTIDGEASFASLVKRYSGDLPYRAVLDELLRTGVVVMTEDDTVMLINEAGYIPSDSEAEQINILGQATADLLETITHNINPDSSETRLQLTVAYDNLSSEAVSQFKAIAQQDGFTLLKQFDTWLAEHDRDSNEGVEIDADRNRAGVGIYFFQEPVSQTGGDTLT